MCDRDSYNWLSLNKVRKITINIKQMKTNTNQINETESPKTRVQKINHYSPKVAKFIFLGVFGLVILGVVVANVGNIFVSERDKLEMELTTLNEQKDNLENQLTQIKSEIEITINELAEVKLEDIEKTPVGEADLAEYTRLKKKVEANPTSDVQIEHADHKVEQDDSTPIIPKAEAKASEEPQQVSATLENKFRMNDGSYQTGEQIVDFTKNHEEGAILWNAFNDRFGPEVADKMAIVARYENGTLWSKTVGVCSSKYRINGDYRQCVYADTNSAGMDVGLIQVNTHYQKSRIDKFANINCTPRNSKDIKDECTARYVEWLQNPNNNMLIATDLFAEQGFKPWVGARKAGMV